jgi:hypothetical protein
MSWFCWSFLAFLELSVELCLPKRPLAFELAFNWDVLSLGSSPFLVHLALAIRYSCAFLRGLSLDQMHLFENPLRQDVLTANDLLRTSIRPSSRRSSAVGPPIRLVL